MRLLRNSSFSIALLACLGLTPARAELVETSGKIIAFGLPVVAAGISYSKGDDRGLSELALVWTTSVGTAFVLSEIIPARRPDRSDYKSFPSDTAASGYAGAGYLWARYGWEYGVPAYALAMYAGYTRTYARKHHWYDVLASSAIAFGANYAFTDRYRPDERLHVSLDADPEDLGVRLSYRW